MKIIFKITCFSNFFNMIKSIFFPKAMKAKMQTTGTENQRNPRKKITKMTPKISLTRIASVLQLEYGK